MAQPTLMYGRKYSKGLNWITAIAMTAFHVLAFAAFFYVTKGALLAALILYFVGGMLGIGMAYHRLLTHRGYKTYKWIEYFLTICGTHALEGGPIFWVATHRVHHQSGTAHAGEISSGYFVAGEHPRMEIMRLRGLCPNPSGAQRGGDQKPFHNPYRIGNQTPVYARHPPRAPSSGKVNTPLPQLL